MKRGFKAPKLVKTSISLPKQLWDFAVASAQVEGYNSVSAYIAELIRADRSSKAKQLVGPAETSSSSPSTYQRSADTFSIMTDAPAKKTGAK
jgi:hypothetical protein